MSEWYQYPLDETLPFSPTHQVQKPIICLINWSIRKAGEFHLNNLCHYLMDPIRERGWLALGATPSCIQDPQGPPKTTNEVTVQMGFVNRKNLVQTMVCYLNGCNCWESSQMACTFTCVEILLAHHYQPSKCSVWQSKWPLTRYKQMTIYDTKSSVIYYFLLTNMVHAPCSSHSESSFQQPAHILVDDPTIIQQNCRRGPKWDWVFDGGWGLFMFTCITHSH